MTELLHRVVALVLDKRNWHNPETDFLFAVDDGFVGHLTVLTPGPSTWSSGFAV